MYTRLHDAITGKVRQGCVRREVDGAIIPADPLNADWQTYRAWVEAGNDPRDPPAPASPPPEA